MGLGAPVKVQIYIKIISIFYKYLKTIKLRQTTENNRGPCMSKNAKCQKATPSGPDQAAICDELGVRPCCFWCPVHK